MIYFVLLPKTTDWLTDLFIYLFFVSDCRFSLFSFKNDKSIVNVSSLLKKKWKNQDSTNIWTSLPTEQLKKSKKPIGQAYNTFLETPLFCRVCSLRDKPKKVFFLWKFEELAWKQSIWQR